jgi:hypothetical protein
VRAVGGDAIYRIKVPSITTVPADDTAELDVEGAFPSLQPFASLGVKRGFRAWLYRWPGLYRSGGPRLW